MADLTLRMLDGTHVVVPASLNSIATYVLLEQEKWFEKEPELVTRLLKPGMTAIDIGANLGVYSLPMARSVGPSGNVYAYEPASETRRLLELSKAKNQANNMNIIGAALSDGTRTGQLMLGLSSELNSLSGLASGPSESVPITSLDSEDIAHGWAAIDFIKIDAEGEEMRILAGAKSFFSRHSPLVMFENVADTNQRQELRSAFVDMGFNIYRQLAGAPILVPVSANDVIDSYELNLFAARSEKATELAEAGLLIKERTSWSLPESRSAAGIDSLKAQFFAPAIAPLLYSGVPIDLTYLDTLAAYAAWRSPNSSLPKRWAALEFACSKLGKLCEREASLARLSTLARFTAEAGYRTKSIEVLNKFIEILESGAGNVVEPFWPASPRFDNVSPSATPRDWFIAAALYQFEVSTHFSSCYGHSNIDLNILSKSPFVPAEIERRRVLRMMRAGQSVEIPQGLLKSADDHINADVWHASFVTNAVARG